MNRSVAFIVLLAGISMAGCGAQDQTHRSNIDQTAVVSQDKFVYMPIHWNGRSYTPAQILPVAKVGKPLGVVSAYPKSEIIAYATVQYAKQLPVGTPVFEVPGISTSKEVAVEVSPNHYVVAPRAARYSSV